MLFSPVPFYVENQFSIRYYNEMPRESFTPETSLPEHFPTIITEVAACEGIADIDVNVSRISEWLTRKGLTPEEIDETTIKLSAKREPSRYGSTRGRYDPRTKTALLYPVLQTRRCTQQYHDADTEEQIAKTYRDGGDLLRIDLDWTLQHELEHRVVHVEGGMPESDRHLAKRDRHIAATALGFIVGSVVSIGAKESFSPSQSMLELGGTVIVLTGAWLAGGVRAVDAIGDRSYRTNPEEQRARAAVSNDWRHSFFSIRLAYQEQPMRTR